MLWDLEKHYYQDDKINILKSPYGFKNTDMGYNAFLNFGLLLNFQQGNEYLMGLQIPQKLSGYHSSK